MYLSCPFILSFPIYSSRQRVWRVCGHGCALHFPQPSTELLYGLCSTIPSSHCVHQHDALSEGQPHSSSLSLPQTAELLMILIVMMIYVTSVHESLFQKIATVMDEDGSYSKTEILGSFNYLKPRECKWLTPAINLSVQSHALIHPPVYM